MAETPTPDPGTTRGSAEHLNFSIIQETDAMRALGIAVHYLMRQPSFANMRFGHWARTLVAQINRGHYALVVRGKEEVVGFLGWAMTRADGKQGGWGFSPRSPAAARKRGSRARALGQRRSR